MSLLPAVMLAVVAALGARPTAAQSVESVRALAADVAVQVSSLTAAGAGPVVVQEFSGPGERAALLTHYLRAELLRGGVVVAAPDGPADYDLRGGLFPLGGTWHVSAELWRRSQKTLVGTIERELAEGPALPDAPPAPKGGPVKVEANAAPPAQTRSFWAVAGPVGRMERNGWSAGVAFRPGSGRWEAGVDTGGFVSDVRRSIPPGNEFHQAAFWYWQVRGAYLHRLDWKYLSVLRAGLGARWLRMTVEHGVLFPSQTTARDRFQPIFEAGAAKRLWGDVELDLRGEWTPTVRTVGGMRTGGFSLLALVGVRLPL